MKTIEERADKYADTICDGKCEKCCMWLPNCRAIDAKDHFIAGAKSEHEELTRWHDPKEELPDKFQPVEIQYTRYANRIFYAIACIVIDYGFDYDREVWNIDSTDIYIKFRDVIGWREIHK